MKIKASHKRFILLTIGSMIIGKLIKKGATKLWETATDEPAPENPNDLGVSTNYAVLWTIGLSIIGGLSKLLYETKVSEQLDGNHDTLPLLEAEEI